MKTQIRDTGEIRVISLAGKITIGSGDVQLREMINESLEQGHTKLILDLGDVSAMDSSGIGEMVASYTSAKKRGAELKLAKLSPKITDILQVTQLITVFETFDSLPEAVESF